MKIKKLLFVTKFEKLCFNALRSLLNLTKADLEHVVFLNIIEKDKVAMHRGVGYQKEEEIRLRETANIRFIEWAESLFEQGLEVGVYITVGSVVSQINIAARKEEADLVVIGQPDKGVLEQLYSGSDVSELIRRSSVPVLVYKYISDNRKTPEKPFNRPLLAIDWSPASMKAVKYMTELENVIQEIHLVYVAGEKDLKGSAMEIQKTRKDARQKLDQICDVFEDKGVEARSHVYIGDPVQEIERAAQECRASLIVVGSSGKAAWVERWIGSTPRKIAEKSEYPTLIIPPETE